MANVLPRLLAALDGELDRAVEDRRRLHAEPELGNEEHRTADLIGESLGEAPAIRVAGTGLLARSGPNDLPAIGIRAELDGLPIEEATGAPFAATNRRMHACGHDVHMAALAALARAAARIGPEVPVPLVAVFQPSEETYPSGAERIVSDGLLEDHGVRAMLGIHVHPDVAWGRVAVDEGAVNASADNLRIVVEGAGGHAAYPHRTRDPVLALSQIVVALQQVVARRLDPMRNGVLTVAWVRAGSSENVIPDRAEAGATLRVLHTEDRTSVLEAVEEVVSNTARAHGCASKVEVTEGEPGLVNDPDLVEAVRALLPDAGLEPADPMRSCGSDDFGYYGSVVPTLMMFLGLRGGGGEDRPLHHPAFLPPDEAVGAVARAQAVAYAGAAEILPRRAT